MTHSYTINDGIASAIINDITQDIHGIMWFATMRGVSSYDGTDWRNYSESDGLPVAAHHFLLTDDSGNIHAFSYYLDKGFSVFDGRRWRTVPAPEHQLPRTGNILISSAALMQNENRLLVGVGTQFHGFFIHEGDGWRQFLLPGDIPGQAPGVFKVAALNGFFYLATEDGLLKVNPYDFKDYRLIKMNTPSPGIYSIAIENVPSPTIWLTGKQWVGYYRDSRFHIVYNGPIPGFNLPFAYHTVVSYPDRHNGLWLGNDKMFYQITADGRLDDLGIRQTLMTTGIRTLFIDRENILWIGTFRGISKISSFRFENFNRPTGLLETEVTAVGELPDGTLVMGHNGGFSFLRNNKIRKVPISGPGLVTPLDSRILDMCRDRDGNVWAAATLLGVAKISPSREITWYRDFGKNERCSCAAVIPDNQGRILASSGDRLFRLVKDRFVPITKKNQVRSYVRRMVKGKNGDIFIIPRDPLIYRLRNDKLDAIVSLERDSGHSFYTAYGTHQTVLLGGRKGLFKIDLKTGKFFRFHQEGFEIHNPVYFILNDREGNLWFGLDNGVIRWDGQNRRHFTTRDGLVGTETNRAAGFVDSRGHLWIGTAGGVSRYNKEKDLDNRLPPTMELLYLKASGTRVPLDTRTAAPITLESDQNDLTFVFRGVSFLDEKATHYQLRLEGYDHAWIQNYRSSDNQVRYTNLPAGRYRFHIRSVNSVGVRSAIVSSGFIRVKKHFRQTPWYYLLLLSVFGGLVFLLTRQLSHRRYARRLEIQVSERTLQLETTLREKEILLKEIHHRVKNNLQIISSMLDLQMDSFEDAGLMHVLKSSKNRIRSIALIHENLYQSRDLETVNMNEYIQNLLAYVWGVYQRPSTVITPKTRVEPISLGIDTAIPVGLIISELLSNALKFAFAGKSRGIIRIKLNRESPRMAVLEVSDNGVGLPPDFDLHDPETLGFQVITTLTEQLDGTLRYETKDGAVFRLTFPLQVQKEEKEILYG